MNQQTRKFLTALLLLLTLSASGQLSKAPSSTRQQRLGELLIVPNGIETTHKLQIRPTYTPSPGWHYVRITATLKNVGPHALCTPIHATLKTTYDMEADAMIDLDHKFDNYFVSQLLPGQELSAEFAFNVKDGVEPVALIVKQLEHRQGCGTTKPVRVTGPLQVRFPISEIPEGEPAAGETPARPQ